MADGDPGYLFYANPQAGGLTYAQLQQRRAIAQSLATRKQGFPKNIGEGLTYLGESIGDAAVMRQAMQAEQAAAARSAAAASTLGLPSIPGAAKPKTSTPLTKTTATTGEDDEAPAAKPAVSSTEKPEETATPEPAKPTKVASAEPDESISTSPPAPATPPPDVNTPRDQIAQAIVANNGTNPNTAAPPPAPAAGQPANPSVVPPPTVPQAAAGGPGAGAMVPPSATPQLPPGQAPQAPPQVTNIPKFDPGPEGLQLPEPLNQQPTENMRRAQAILSNAQYLDPSVVTQAQELMRQELATQKEERDRYEKEYGEVMTRRFAEEQRRLGNAQAAHTYDITTRFDDPTKLAALQEAQAKAASAIGGARFQYGYQPGMPAGPAPGQGPFQASGAGLPPGAVPGQGPMQPGTPAPAVPGQVPPPIAQQAALQRPPQQQPPPNPFAPGGYAYYPGGAGIAPNEAYTHLAAARKDVQGVPVGIQAIRNMNQMLDQGMFTGTGATHATEAGKLARYLPGQWGAAQDAYQTAQRTEQFAQQANMLKGALRAGVIGPGSMSDTEQRILERAAAGDPTLEAKTLRNVLSTMYDRITNDAIQHQRAILASAGGNEQLARNWQSVHGINMAQVVSPSEREALRAHPNDQRLIYGINQHYQTPGLAESIVGGA